MESKRELNVIRKNIKSDAVRVAYIYPNIYSVGMQSLATKLIYYLFNIYSRDIVCERVFYPQRKKISQYDFLREPSQLQLSIPRSMETGTPMSSFSVLAVSLSFELDYVNFIRMLQASQISPLRTERSELDPLIIAGGPAITANPLPLASIVDVIVLGEIEPIIKSLTTILATERNDKTQMIASLSELEGVYIPRQTDPFQQPLRVANLDKINFPTAQVRPIFPRGQKTQLDKFLIQISRGCNRACHFCLIGNMFRPVSELSLEKAKLLIEQGTEETETSRVALIGSSISDYNKTEELLSFLNQEKIQFSIPSVRIDTNTEILEQLVANGQNMITIAPEVADEQLRFSLGKRITNELYLNFVEKAHKVGISKLKAYYMIGLPNQTQHDLDQLISMTRTISNLFSKRNHRLTISPFVPKRRTPLENMEYDVEKNENMASYLKKRLQSIANISISSTHWNYVQWLLASGDERMGSILIEVAKTKGSLSNWKNILASSDLVDSQL